MENGEPALKSISLQMRTRHELADLLATSLTSIFGRTEVDDSLQMVKEGDVLHWPRHMITLGRGETTKRSTPPFPCALFPLSSRLAYSLHRNQRVHPADWMEVNKLKEAQICFTDANKMLDIIYASHEIDQRLDGLKVACSVALSYLNAKKSGRTLPNAITCKHCHQRLFPGPKQGLDCGVNWTCDGCNQSVPNWCIAVCRNEHCPKTDGYDLCLTCVAEDLPPTTQLAIRGNQGKRPRSASGSPMRMGGKGLFS